MCFVGGVNVLGMLTKCVDQCNGVASRIECNDAANRIRMAVIDLRRKDNIVDGCHDIASRMRMTVIDVSRITVIDNEIWLGMLTKGVEGCNGIASRMRMTVIGLRRKNNIVDGCNDIASRTTVIDDEIWRKYSLRRCLRM